MIFLPGYIENYDVEPTYVVHHVREQQLAANWKTGADAFDETYHLVTQHPQTQTVMEDDSQYDLYLEWRELEDHLKFLL